MKAARGGRRKARTKRSQGCGTRKQRGTNCYNSQLGVGNDDAPLEGVGGGGAVHGQAQLLDAGGVLFADDGDGLLGGDVFVLFARGGFCGRGVLFFFWSVFISDSLRCDWRVEVGLMGVTVCVTLIGRGPGGKGDGICKEKGGK